MKIESELIMITCDTDEEVREVCERIEKKIKVFHEHIGVNVCMNRKTGSVGVITLISEGYDPTESFFLVPVNDIELITGSTKIGALMMLQRLINTNGVDFSGPSPVCFGEDNDPSVCQHCSKKHPQIYEKCLAERVK